MHDGKAGEKLGVPFSLMIGILASFGDDAVNTAITPIFASMSAAFPDIPYVMITWMYSMPKIIIIPFALLSGYLAGRRVGFKTIALVGMGIIAVAGVIPFFMNDFWTILASRMVLAIGLGLQAPIGPALVMRFFQDGPRRSFALGLGNGVLNGVSILTGLLIGNLCAIEWHLSFLGYLGMFLLFILTLLFLKEPPSVAEVKGTSVTQKQLRGSVPKTAIFLCGFFALVDCIWMAATMNISAIVAQMNWGDAGTTSWLMSLISLAGFLLGLTYGPYCRVTKQYNIAASLFLAAIAVTFIACAQAIWMLAVGLFLGGATFCLIICGIQNELGVVCAPVQMALASALFMVFEHLGGFLSSWWMALIMIFTGEEAYQAPSAVAAVIFFLASLIFAFIAHSGLKRTKTTNR